MQKLVNQNSKGPYIGFRSIIVIDQAFGTHVNGAADWNVCKQRFGADGEPKVGNFVILVAEENVGNFKVSVDDKIFIQIL